MSPLWFGEKPSSPLHIPANILRVLIALVLAFAWTRTRFPDLRIMRNLFKGFSWSREWPQTPDAMLVEVPRPGADTKIGEYAVTGYKPRWLLEVHFEGSKIAAQRQVRYEHRNSGSSSDHIVLGLEGRELHARIQEEGYIAISYAMQSAERLASESGLVFNAQPPNSTRKYSLKDRRRIAQTLLDEYAKARRTMKGKSDGYEYIWLDEFCLSGDSALEGEDVEKQRHMELGQLADIFRGARKVVVFCHVIDCDHTGVDCPWGNRLFTLGEILNTPKVLRMTRVQKSKSSDGDAKPVSVMVALSGQEFRMDMQARAAEVKMWHLYNIMQHATNSGTVTWQSAIHSLVVEAVRRDEAAEFHAHNLLGKALNGLLPRRSQIADLHGVSGWADLAWLLELNQGYYNAAMLAAVCKLADPEVDGYRWWGKPIAPREGCERLEPLATAIPIRFRDYDANTSTPVLCLVGPKSVELDHMLQRDSGGLDYHPEMRSLKWWGNLTSWILAIIGLAVMSVNPTVGFVMAFFISHMFYAILQLLVGTIYIEKNSVIVIEDHKVPNRDAYGYIKSKDPSFSQAVEWGSRQLIPQWDVPHLLEPSAPGQPIKPYPVTIVDLGTGVFTKALVTSRPNDMVVLAVHGSGITTILIDRAKDSPSATISVKVGMANLPPFVLAHAQDSGSVYVGGGPCRHRPDPVPFMRKFWRTVTGEDPGETKQHLPAPLLSRLNKGADEAPSEKDEMKDISSQSTFIDFEESLAHTSSRTPILPSHDRPYIEARDSSAASMTTLYSHNVSESQTDLGTLPHAAPQYHETDARWAPLRRIVADNGR